MVLLTAITALLFACNRPAVQSAAESTGLFINGTLAETVLLYGHCKTQSDFVYGAERFKPVWSEAKAVQLAPGTHRIEIIYEQVSSTFLGDAINQSTPPILVLFKLDDNLSVTPQSELSAQTAEQMSESVMQLDGAIDVQGKIVSVGEGLIAERFDATFEPGRYVIANHKESW